MRALSDPDPFEPLRALVAIWRAQAEDERPDATAPPTAASGRRRAVYVSLMRCAHELEAWIPDRQP